jgi:major vault protein
MSDELSPGEYLESRDRGSSLRGDTRYDDGRLGAEFPSETSRRTTAHTPPRTIVLDNKYDGAVSVSIWPGYAVLVTNKTGRRRVEVGPKVILLDYDEILMPMELSTGKPKTTDHLIRTAYLRTANNQVSDIVTVETRDLVRVEIKLSLRANFEAQNEVGRQKWFDVENYVKLLTDHVRSRLRRIAKGYGIQEFYRDTIDIVRNEILGEVPADGQRRPGMLFEECGLRVYDVEILQVSISDHNVAALLQDAQSHALEGAIRLSQAEDESRQLRASEELARANLRFRHETTEARAALEAEALALELRSRLAKVHAALEEAREQRVVTELEMGMEMRRANQRVQIQKAANEAELERLREEATIYVTRMAAINEQFGQALQNFGDKSFVEALVTSLGPVAATMGLTSGDLLKQVFEGTPFSGVLESLSDRPFRAGQRAIAGS